MSWSCCRPAGECDVGVPELVSAQWWAELGLRVSGSRGLGVDVGLLVGGFRSQQMAAGSWESCGWCSVGQCQVLCPLLARTGSLGPWELKDSKGSQPAGR